MLQFCGLPQVAASGMPDEYFTHNGFTRNEFVGRTPLEERHFSFALAEMSRLYAYRDVSVLVMPEPATPSAFSNGGGTPLLRNGDRVRLDGTDVVLLTGLGKGTVLNWSATNGNGEVITLDHLEGSTTELIERRVENATCRFTNPCRWGRINSDPYRNRGWVPFGRDLTREMADTRSVPPFDSSACVLAFTVLL